MEYLKECEREVASLTKGSLAKERVHRGGPNLQVRSPRLPGPLSLVFTVLSIGNSAVRARLLGSQASVRGGIGLAWPAAATTSSTFSQYGHAKVDKHDSGDQELSQVRVALVCHVPAASRDPVCTHRPDYVRLCHQ